MKEYTNYKIYFELPKNLSDELIQSRDVYLSKNEKEKEDIINKYVEKISEIIYSNSKYSEDIEPLIFLEKTKLTLEHFFEQKEINGKKLEVSSIASYISTSYKNALKEEGLVNSLVSAGGRKSLNDARKLNRLYKDIQKYAAKRKIDIFNSRKLQDNLNENYMKLNKYLSKIKEEINKKNQENIGADIYSEIKDILKDDLENNRILEYIERNIIRKKKRINKTYIEDLIEGIKSEYVNFGEEITLALRMRICLEVSYEENIMYKSNDSVKDMLFDSVHGEGIEKILCLFVGFMINVFNTSGRKTKKFMQFKDFFTRNAAKQLRNENRNGKSNESNNEVVEHNKENMLDICHNIAEFYMEEKRIFDENEAIYMLFSKRYIDYIFKEDEIEDILFRIIYCELGEKKNFTNLCIRDLWNIIYEGKGTSPSNISGIYKEYKEVVSAIIQKTNENCKTLSIK